MISKKQIAVIGAIVVLMGILLSLDIKGLVAPKENRQQEKNEQQSAVSSVTVASVSESAKSALNNPGIVKQIEGLEAQLANDPQNLVLKKKLAKQWDDLNVASVSGLYYLDIAKAENTIPAWLLAGNKLQAGYQNANDSTVVSYLSTNATEAFETVLKQDPNNLDAKTGLGTCYVETTPNPMQGIAMLRDVVTKDPENVKANLNLGMFAMRTGQYDKAEKRFLTVLKKAPSAEAYFYLGETYRNLGQKQKAIDAFLKTKEYIVDPQFTTQIDNIIKELK